MPISATWSKGLHISTDRVGKIVNIGRSMYRMGMQLTLG